MKKILLLIAGLFIYFFSLAQTPSGFTKVQSSTIQNGAGADSAFYLPKRDTNFTPSRIGLLVVRPADSCLYMGIKITAGGQRWMKMARITDAGTGGGSVSRIGVLGSLTKSANGLRAQGDSIVAWYADSVYAGLMSPAMYTRLMDSLNLVIASKTDYTPLGTTRDPNTILIKGLQFNVNGTLVTPTPDGDSLLAWNITAIADTSHLSDRINLKVNISDTANMLTNYVRNSRSINTGYGLTGSGDLSANRTLLLDSATVANYFFRRKDTVDGFHSENYYNTKYPGINTVWNRLGNSSTTPGTDFIGTTDVQDLMIKTNGVQRMNISSAGQFDFGLYGATNSGTKFTNQNLWSVDSAHQFRLRSFRASDSSMQLIESKAYGTSGLKRITISSQDTAMYSTYTLDHDHITNEVYTRNPTTLRTGFYQDAKQWSFAGPSTLAYTIMNIDTNYRVAIKRVAPDSTFSVGGSIYGTGPVRFSGLPTSGTYSKSIGVASDGTLFLKDTAAYSTFYNSNVGSGYRFVLPNTNNIKTFTATNGLTADSATTNQIGVILGGAQTANTTIGAYGGTLYSTKFTNQNLWSVDSARQWRLRTWRAADSSQQIITTSSFGSSGVKRMTLSSQDSAALSNIIIDNNSIAFNNYQRNNSSSASNTFSMDTTVWEYVNNIYGGRVSFYRDSFQLKPPSGILNIYSLRTSTDTTYKKPMTWDTRNGRWEYLTSWGNTGFGAGGSMTYPGAGIANSTGSAWGTSYTTTGSGTVLALAASPAFSGSPTAPTQSANDNSTKIATTAYADAASSKTLQQVFATQSNTAVMTGTNIIDASSNDFSITGAVALELSSNASAGNVLLSTSIGNGNESQINVKRDTIKLMPHLGNLYIDTINHTPLLSTTMMVWDSTTGKVYHQPIPSGANTALSNLASVAITAPLSITTANTTQVTTASAIALNANSLTTGTGLYLASSTLTSGSMIDVAVTGTATDNNQKGINVSLSGANGSSAKTSYAGYFSNTRTGTTAVDVGVYATSSLNSNGSAGVYANNSGAGYALYAKSSTGVAVYGVNNANSDIGVYGQGYWGVYGLSSVGVGVYAASLGTNKALYVDASSITSGMAADMQINTTGALTGQTGWNILMQGATSTNAVTSYGMQISNIHTNATSGTNVGLYLNASGATTANYGLIVNAGSAGFNTTAPNSTVHISGSLATAYTGSAVDITATASHQVIALTVTGKTVTLPTAVGITGRLYTVKLTASGSGTVATTSSQTIDGSTTYSLSAQYKYVTVQSDGANWNIIANN